MTLSEVITNYVHDNNFPGTHKDVLENIRAMIIFYKNNQESCNNFLDDSHVSQSIEWLITHYSADPPGKIIHPLKGISGELTKKLKVICEIHLNSENFSIQEDKLEELRSFTRRNRTQEVNSDEILKCLKFIKKEIKQFTQTKRGEGGYLVGYLAEIDRITDIYPYPDRRFELAKILCNELNQE
jgi:hypothetical protein